MSSYKRIVFLICLCLMALLCVSCASVKQHEYEPLDYTREDVRNNEINQISALLKKADHKAIYTEGICNLTVTTNSGEVINSKEYGTYESTITLTIENHS